jgi:hypothetical protein
MSTMTEQVRKSTNKAPETPKVAVPTWAALKASYRAAETSGVKARFKAYDAVVRAYALTDETATDAKSGAVTARSEADRNREVLDSLNIAAGNVFSISAIRVGQLVKVYRAIALSGTDPFSDLGKKSFTAWDAIRKADITSLDAHAEDVKTAEAGKAGAVLAAAVETAKQVAKDRAASNKAAKVAGEPKTVTVNGLAQVLAFAESALPVVRKMSATASEAEKAATRKALEALIAHLG